MFCVRRWAVVWTLIVVTLGGLPGGSITHLNQPFALAQSAPGELQPGDVFREFGFPQRLTLCFRPSNPASCNNIPSERSAGLTFDPAGATRAELAIEYWGGHIGTRQHFRVNAQNDWQPLPPIQNVPPGARQQCYFRTILGRTLPLDLSQLRNGENRFRFNISHNNQFGQDTSCPGNFGWGTTYIYGFTARLYYTPGSIPAPSGSIVSPAENATIGEMPQITVQATPPAGRTIARIDDRRIPRLRLGWQRRAARVAVSTGAHPDATPYRLGSARRQRLPRGLEHHLDPGSGRCEWQSAASAPDGADHRQ
jgi:hypothetical protein